MRAGVVQTKISILWRVLKEEKCRLCIKSVSSHSRKLTADFNLLYVTSPVLKLAVKI
jgi:hypothetical protein